MVKGTTRSFSPSSLAPIEARKRRKLATPSFVAEGDHGRLAGAFDRLPVFGEAAVEAHPRLEDRARP